MILYRTCLLTQPTGSSFREPLYGRKSNGITGRIKIEGAAQMLRKGRKIEDDRIIDYMMVIDVKEVKNENVFLCARVLTIKY